MNRSASNWINSLVRAKNGDIGTVEQLYFDDLTWSIRYMSVKVGGTLPSRNILISLAALDTPDWEKRVFPVNLTLAQIRSSPNTNTEEPVLREHEVALHAHYAWPHYWGGGFYVPTETGLGTIPAVDAETIAAIRSSRVQKLGSHLRSTQEVMGSLVHATDGNIGHVEDFLADEGWVIRYLVVNTRNWQPDRRVLVSPQWIRKISWIDKKVFVDLSQEAVKKSPKYNPLKPVSLDYESRLLSHLKKPEFTEWIMFKFHAPPGSNVYVAGTFNNWDPTAIKLGDNTTGAYVATVLLPLGRYEYKFIVNGDWHNGPDGSEQVPNSFGTTNNVLVVERIIEHPLHHPTFSRLSVSEDRLLWRTPLGG